MSGFAKDTARKGKLSYFSAGNRGKCSVGVCGGSGGGGKGTCLCRERAFCLSSVAVKSWLFISKGKAAAAAAAVANFPPFPPPFSAVLFYARFWLLLCL